MILSMASPILERVDPARRNIQEKAMKKSLIAPLMTALREFIKIFDDDWFIFFDFWDY